MKLCGVILPCFIHAHLEGETFRARFIWEWRAYKDIRYCPDCLLHYKESESSWISNGIYFLFCTVWIAAINHWIKLNWVSIWAPGLHFMIISNPAGRTPVSTKITSCGLLPANLCTLNRALIIKLIAHRCLDLELHVRVLLGDVLSDEASEKEVESKASSASSPITRGSSSAGAWLPPPHSLSPNSAFELANKFTGLLAHIHWQ